jgi:hypothetical protein
MKKRSCLSLLTMMMLFFTTTTQGLQAADSVAAAQDKLGANHFSHTVSGTELHQLIQNSQKQLLESRERIQSFLARPDIKAAIRHAGGNVEKINLKVALLSDEEILGLNQQMMSLDLQRGTSGGAAKVIIGIILLALSIYFLVEAVT